MKPKIKALWISSWYPNRIVELGGIFVKRHAEATSLYASIAIMHAVSDPSVKKDYFIDISFKPFLSVLIYYPITKNPIIKAIRILKAYKKGYVQVLKNWGKPDIVHIHVLFPAGIFGWYLNLFERLPFVVTEHRGGYIHKEGSYQGLFMKLFTKLTIRRAKAVLAISEYFSLAMKNHGLKNRYYAIVPNVVDTNIFKPLLKKDSNENEIFNFIHVSGLHDSVKNITGILRSIGQLAKIRQDFCVKIIGDIEEHAPYLALSSDLGILNVFVFFFPQISHIEVAFEMQKADSFLLFSNIEGLPCVILEAMSVGLPIIATETGGISDCVTLEKGILLNIGDEKGLVEAMNDVIENKYKYNPLSIRQAIVEKCGYETVGQAIVKVYTEVLHI